MPAKTAEPWPRRNPNRPPSNRPRIIDPPNPFRKPGRCGNICVCPAALFGARLGVIERSIGATGCGAVLVGGADWNVRMPRLPKLPPRRASA